jgi:hypothetical protein
MTSEVAVLNAKVPETSGEKMQSALSLEMERNEGVAGSG